MTFYQRLDLRLPTYQHQLGSTGQRIQLDIHKLLLKPVYLHNLLLAAISVSDVAEQQEHDHGNQSQLLTKEAFRKKVSGYDLMQRHSRHVGELPHIAH